MGLEKTTEVKMLLSLHMSRAYAVNQTVCADLGP